MLLVHASVWHGSFCLRGSTVHDCFLSLFPTWCPCSNNALSVLQQIAP